VTTTTRRPRGRPTGGHPVVDRERVLEAAERVIARDGNGASLDSIALEAGVTKPIVYSRVGSRAELSDALAERLAERLITAGRAEVNSAVLDRDMLAGFFGTTLETMAANRELLLFVTRGAADDMAERTLHLATQSVAPLTELLRMWRTHQGRDTSVAEPWGYAIVGMLNLVSLWWIDNGGHDAATLAGQLADLVWAGLGTHD
jgi:AcrR family transcriptional regulator